ncbi:uncharacterized protein LOC113516178 [Galleria mellonella]|uniref:Uncharacterized protein LOC113516178 n=1 Tax=Galleria mellonella TaxID=7137 RepID=A0ABM3MUH7_GALME|nr:uncharacterized protein LOC113516178 [Galleria mellonella]
MEEKTFVWTSDLNKRLFQLRFDNDWLFKKKKQPWREFYKILLDNGFPEEMTINHVRKKWSYTYDMYKLAKKTKNKSWPYYKIFDKHFGKSKILDKYESWSDEWRLKLILCISEAKEVKLEDFQTMWRTVERAMRSQDLPNDCCIQDMKGLWQHIRTTFNRKHRLKMKKGAELTEWPLYDAMIKYFQLYEPDYLINLEKETAGNFMVRQRNTSKYCKKKKDTDKNGEDDEGDEFQWSKHITETFIQTRLQNDWIFKQRKWAWNDLLAIMIEEYGFPETLTSREISRKWASTFAEYQKAKATNNKSWVYYNLFELYLGEGTLSLNPLIGWQEEWVFNLISARTDLEHLFKFSLRDPNHGWREVEKRLRNIGLPFDHSLLDLPEIWTHLLKTFRWKQKFLNKGILNEQWPYYEAIAQYVETEAQHRPVKKQKQEEQEHYDDVAIDDDLEDDMKLLELKQRLQVRPKREAIDPNQCRTCYSEHGSVDIFEQRDDDDPDIAQKLRLIGGIEVEKSDNLPSHICYNCLRDLDVAYKFRRKCQEVDNKFRCTDMLEIKIEKHDDDGRHYNDSTKNEPERNDSDDMDIHFDDLEPGESIAKTVKPPVKKETKTVVRKRKKVRKSKYDYWKICEVCGKHTRNLVSHLDMHLSGKHYSCNVCDKKFKFKSGLVIHKAIHDPTPRKTCEVCGKAFHILAQYRRHFVYHANERKFECETCGKRFNTMDILKVHNRMHTNERPFSCQECGKTFRTAGCVSRHKRIVHKNIKVQCKMNE